MKDDGLTFGTNAKGGVCIHFRQKVPSPLRRKGHSALTVTVKDLDALTNVLSDANRNASGDSDTQHRQRGQDLGDP